MYLLAMTTGACSYASGNVYAIELLDSMWFSAWQRQGARARQALPKVRSTWKLNQTVNDFVQSNGSKTMNNSASGINTIQTIEFRTKGFEPHLTITWAGSRGGPLSASSVGRCFGPHICRCKSQWGPLDRFAWHYASVRRWAYIISKLIRLNLIKFHLI